MLKLIDSIPGGTTLKFINEFSIKTKIFID